MNEAPYDVLFMRVVNADDGAATTPVPFHAYSFQVGGMEWEG